MRLQAVHRNLGSGTVTAPNSVAMRWLRQSFRWHFPLQAEQHGRCSPWLRLVRKRPLVERSPEAASLPARSIPGSAISQRPSGRQISIRSVLRQRASPSVAINRNTHRIPVPPVGYRPDRPYPLCRHTPILWTLPQAQAGCEARHPPHHLAQSSERRAQYAMRSQPTALGWSNIERMDDDLRRTFLSQGAWPGIH